MTFISPRTCSWVKLRRRPFDNAQLYDLEGLHEPGDELHDPGIEIELEIVYRRNVSTGSLSSSSASLLSKSALSSRESLAANEATREEQALDVAEERAASVVSTDSFNPTGPERERSQSLFERISGWFVSDVEYAALMRFMELVQAFGQGLEVSNLALSVGYSILSKYYGEQPITFTNNQILTKETFEIPRLLYKFTMATYGWRGLYVFGKTRITETIRTNADLHAALDYLAIPKSEMLIFELGEVSQLRPNFFVCIDRRLSAVILSIRGTMSLRDVLIDLTCEYEEWQGGLAHSGMLSAARWFMENVSRQLILIAQEHGLENVYVVGHSMGGSIASLVTMLLVEHLREAGEPWPCVRIAEEERPLVIHSYSYGAAPVVTEEIASRWTAYVDQFIMGEDLVPRLCYGSVIDFQSLLVYAAEIGSTSHMFRAIPPEILTRIDKCRQEILQRPHRNPKLALVGRIHHLLKLRAPNDRSYYVIDTCQNGDRFREMAIRPKMFVHHLPSKYSRALDYAYACFIAQELEEKSESVQEMRSLAEALARTTLTPPMVPPISPRLSPVSSTSQMTVLEREELMEEIYAAPASPLP